MWTDSPGVQRIVNDLNLGVMVRSNCLSQPWEDSVVALM